MYKWRFGGGSTALLTSSGIRQADRIHVAADGCALYGPYIDVPAGRLTARVLLEGECRGIAMLDIVDAGSAHILAEKRIDLAVAGPAAALSVDLAGPVGRLEVRLIGDLRADVVGLEIDLAPDAVEPSMPDRPVGYESTKTYARKIESGFWRTYFSGDAVLELGYKGYYGTTVPIVPQAIGVDVGYPGYDGVTLPFADESFDAVYSSHCLEHIPDYVSVMRDWYRLLKVGGYLMIVVPLQHLFEKRAVMPSLSNPDHRRYYTPESLLLEISEALPANSYRVRHLRENDEGFDYSLPPRVPSGGCFEIELVIEKIRKPNWNNDDNSVRHYSAGEFSSAAATRPNPWTIEVDFTRTGECVVYGPYATLQPARYVAEFHFTVADLAELEHSTLRLDIGRDMNTVEWRDLTGAEGIAALKHGIVAVPFTVPSTAHYEFRLYRFGRPVPGSVRFRGVVLRYE